MDGCASDIKRHIKICFQCSLGTIGVTVGDRTVPNATLRVRKRGLLRRRGFEARAGGRRGRG